MDSLWREKENESGKERRGEQWGKEGRW